MLDFGERQLKTDDSEAADDRRFVREISTEAFGPRPLG